MAQGRPLINFVFFSLGTLSQCSIRSKELNGKYAIVYLSLTYKEIQHDTEKCGRFWEGRVKLELFKFCSVIRYAILVGYE